MTIFTSSIWERSKPYRRYLLSGVLLLVIALISWSIWGKKDDDKQPEQNQETALLNPRIGEPLAPDVNPEGLQGQASVPGVPGIAGDSTETPSEVASQPQGEAMVAPPTGIDDDGPVAYSNDQLKFAATLPPGTKVTETSDGIIFRSSTGQNYFVVSTAVLGKETLQTLQTQLQNSPTVKNISQTTIDGLPALKFQSADNSGIMLIKGNTIYYLIGQKYLETFRTI